jgi:hypothetical protein
VPTTGPFLTLANLSIPQAGRYVISAKTGVVATTGAGGQLTCNLVVVGIEQIDGMSTLVFGNNYSGVALVAVRDFPTAGSVDLRCAATSGALSAQDIRVAAVSVANPDSYLAFTPRRGAGSAKAIGERSPDAPP